MEETLKETPHNICVVSISSILRAEVSQYLIPNTAHSVVLSFRIAGSYNSHAVKLLETLHLRGDKERKL